MEARKRRAESDAALALSVFFFPPVIGRWPLTPPPQNFFSNLSTGPISLSSSTSLIVLFKNGPRARIRPTIAARRVQGDHWGGLPGSITEIHQPLNNAVEGRGNRTLESVECRCTEEHPAFIAGVETGTALFLRDSANCPRPHHAAQARRGVSPSQS